jgi:deoxyhypusine synthase
MTKEAFPGAHSLLDSNVNASHNIIMAFSEEIPEDSIKVAGPDFEAMIRECPGADDDRLARLLRSYASSGFQATNIGAAIDEVNRMLAWRAPEPAEGEEPVDESKARCKIFLGYTSNMVSSGMRDIIKFLVKHKLVHVVVTTAGGIEEDFIKCLAPLIIGDFHLSGEELRRKGMNRIGNLLMPNENYRLFEDWLSPILDAMVEETKGPEGTVWSPSKLINRLGKEINNEDSIYYWCWKNDIPVFCPAITDGSLGDMIYFHSYSKPGMVLDLVQDIRALNNQAVRAGATGMVILGGGVMKHHICNANLMRNGAEFSVFINTGNEFDGSDSGASPDEAVSWGKIKMTAKPVKVFCEATIAFPLIVAETFAKHLAKQQQPAADHSSTLYI